MKTETANKRLSHEAVEQLREPSQHILESLRNHIDQGNLKLIIGDDSSGRVLALVIEKTIKALHASLGHPLPTTVFLQGQRRSEDSEKRKFSERIREMIREMKRTQRYPYPISRNMTQGGEPLHFDGKTETLIVTDAVHYGRALKPLTSVLHDEKLGFEIATLGTWNRTTYGTTIHDGHFYDKHNESQRMIYQAYDLAGVMRGSHPLYASPYYGNASRDGELCSVRDDVRKLSEYLVTWYARRKESGAKKKKWGIF